MGGASILAASRERPIDMRTLAIVNSKTMAAHQVEEYVEPGYSPGQVNAGMFKSDQPLNYPFNARSAGCGQEQPIPLHRQADGPYHVG